MPVKSQGQISTSVLSTVSVTNRVLDIYCMSESNTSLGVWPVISTVTTGVER